jgi:hypothetical protein
MVLGKKLTGLTKAQRKQAELVLIKEADVLPDVRLALSRSGCVAFRNQAGLYTLIDGRRIKTGLIEGASDIIGWQSVEITPEMVGTKIARFVAVEVKRPVGGRLSKEQKKFIDRVNKDGGVAGVARSGFEAVMLVGKPSPKMLDPGLK